MLRRRRTVLAALTYLACSTSSVVDADAYIVGRLRGATMGFDPQVELRLEL